MNGITLIDLIVKLEEYNKEEIVSNAYFYAYNLHNEKIKW